MLRSASLAGIGLVALGCGRVLTEVGAELDADCTPTASYIEVDGGALSGGFTIRTDPDAGGAYLSPPADAQSLQVPGNASANYTFPISCAGTYLLWGRIHGPDAVNNTFWLSVDGEPFYQWRLSTGVIWYWHPATRGVDYKVPVLYALEAGVHQVTLRNSASGIGLQRLFVAIPGDVPPGNDTPCHPPDSIQLADGGCEVSCGSHGNTTCGSVACAGLPPLVAYDCNICCFVLDGGGPSDGSASDSAVE